MLTKAFASPLNSCAGQDKSWEHLPFHTDRSRCTSHLFLVLSDHMWQYISTFWHTQCSTVFIHTVQTVRVDIWLFLPQYWATLWIVNMTTGKSRKAASTHINCIPTKHPVYASGNYVHPFHKTANMTALKCWLKPWHPSFVLAIITLGTRALYASCSKFLQHFFPACDWSPSSTSRFRCRCDLVLPWHCAFISPELNRTWSMEHPLFRMCPGGHDCPPNAQLIQRWFIQSAFTIVKMVQFVSILSH